MSFCLTICLSLHLTIWLSDYLSVYLSICLFLSICLSIYLSILQEAFVRDFHQKWNLARPKRSNSARLPRTSIGSEMFDPERRWFVQFDFDMCFAQQRCALFCHLNFQKCSENGVLCTFWLRDVLRATTACIFSSFIWPNGSAPAAWASLLFDPPQPQNIWKT